jgi:hypothetical protein
MINQVLTDYPRSARAHYVAAELALRACRLVVARSDFNQAELGLRLANGRSPRSSAASRFLPACCSQAWG